MVALFLGAIIAANLLVTWGGQAMLVWTAWLLIPFDMLTRDALHQRWERTGVWKPMLTMIAAGGLLSLAINSGSLRIAIASCVAFTIATVLDAIAYDVAGENRLVRMNAGNAASATVDSILFPTIAWGAVDPILSAWQAGSKFAGGMVFSLLFVVLIKTGKVRA